MKTMKYHYILFEEFSQEIKSNMKNHFKLLIYDFRLRVLWQLQIIYSVVRKKEGKGNTRAGFNKKYWGANLSFLMINT